MSDDLENDSNGASDSAATRTLQLSFPVNPDLQKELHKDKVLDEAIRQALTAALIVVLEKNGILKAKGPTFGIEDSSIDWKGNPDRKCGGS